MTPQSLLVHAFELMQLALLVIVFFAIYTLRAGERRLSRMYRASGPAHRLRQPFAWFLLLSLAILVFTRDMLPLRTALLRGVPFPNIDQALAVALVFMLDLIGAALLVAYTGGYAKSPFTPILLLLPVLAILLRQTPLRVAAYAAGAALLLALLVRVPAIEIEVNPLQRQATVVVTWGCLGLCVLLGYLMRLPL